MKPTRIRLIAGQSSGREWVASDAPSGSRVDVGNSENASWKVSAPGVKGLHLQLYWDGTRLWVADLHNAGGVGMGGALIRDWTALDNGSRITFGSAALQVEAPDATDIAPPAQHAKKSGRPSSPDRSALRGIPTQVAAEAAAQPQSTKLTSLDGVPKGSPDSAPTPPPVIGAGVERISNPNTKSASPSAAPRFAPPPPEGEAGSKDDENSKASTRTRILGGTLLIAAVAVLLMPGPEPQNTVAPTSESTAPAALPAPNYEAQIRPIQPTVPTPEELSEGALTPARQAADALLGGRTWEAADRYAGLSEQDPANSTYRLLSRLLARELRLRCQDDPDAYGDRCAR